MCIETVNLVLNHSRAVGSRRVLLLVIAFREWAAPGSRFHGWCSRSLEELSRETNISKNHLSNYLKDLEEAGEIVVRRGEGDRGRNLYRVVVGRSEMGPPSLVPGGDNPVTPPDTPLEPQGGPNLDTKGVQGGHPIKEEKKNKTPEDSTTPTLAGAMEWATAYIRDKTRPNATLIALHLRRCRDYPEGTPTWQEVAGELCRLCREGGGG